MCIVNLFTFRWSARPFGAITKGFIFKYFYKRLVIMYLQAEKLRADEKIPLGFRGCGVSSSPNIVSTADQPDHFLKVFNIVNVSNKNTLLSTDAL